jgi:hypothetical protein
MKGPAIRWGLFVVCGERQSISFAVLISIANHHRLQNGSVRYRIMGGLVVD